MVDADDQVPPKASDADAPAPPAPGGPAAGAAVAKAWLTLFMVCIAGFAYSALFALPDAFEEFASSEADEFRDRSESLLATVERLEARIPADHPARDPLQKARDAHLIADIEKGTNLEEAQHRLSEGFAYLCEVELQAFGKRCPPVEDHTLQDILGSPYTKVAMAGVTGTGAALTARPARPSGALRALWSWLKGLKGAPA